MAIIGLASNMNASHNPTTQNNLPIIDWEASVALLDGNTDLAKNMLMLLFNELAELKPRMSNLLANQQFDELAKLAHQLRGGSAYCGVSRLQYSCDRLETAIRNNVSSDTVSHLVEDLLEQIDLVLTTAKTYLKDNSW